MLVVGDREMEADAVAVRQRDGEDLGAMPIGELGERLRQEASN
jgi:threonyl-tRNA synthetase